ncbi:MAG: ribosome maturation factor RimP [Deltaproteobacteria bacterium]
MTAKTQLRQTVERVKTLLDPVVEREGYELLDVEYVSDRGRMILRLYIDTVPPGTPEKGVTVEDCSFVSRTVGDILDVEEVIGDKYHLEVSSPGLFRPLTKPAHFDRVVGERVKVKTFEKLDGRRVFTGTLTAHEGGELTVHIDGTDFSLNLDNVAKANLEPELDF